MRWQKKFKKIIAHNVLWLCVRFFALSEWSSLAQYSKAKTDAKPLLPAGAVYLAGF